MTGAVAAQLWPALALGLVAVVALGSALSDLLRPPSRTTVGEQLTAAAFVLVFGFGALLCAWWVYQLLAAAGPPPLL